MPALTDGNGSNPVHAPLRVCLPVRMGFFVFCGKLQGSP